MKKVIIEYNGETSEYHWCFLNDYPEFSGGNKQYNTYAYYGGSDHTEIEKFKENGEILISTDNGAKGFDFSEASFAVMYSIFLTSFQLIF